VGRSPLRCYHQLSQLLLSDLRSKSFPLRHVNRYRDLRRYPVREHPQLWEAFQHLGEEASRAGPLDAHTRRLIHLALAVAAGSEGAISLARAGMRASEPLEA
jgi:alkylhydroperoxidase/carboxymuconolactone decarboxylase family protein YurZ